MMPARVIGRSIGVDPSLASTGVAQDDGLLLTIKTHKADGDARLRKIYDTTFEAAGKGKWTSVPALAIIEDLPKNAMGAGLTGQAAGVVRMAIADAGISCIAIPAMSLKKFATGDGRADKKKMIATWHDYASARRYPCATTKDDNQVDAAWLREYGRVLLAFARADADHRPSLGEDRMISRFAGDVEMARRVLDGFVF